MRALLGPATLAPMRALFHLRGPSLCLLMGLLAVLILTTACGNDEQALEVDRQEVVVMLEEYLALFSEGYATGNLQPMLGPAAEKEVATVAKQLEQYAAQGVTVKPTLQQLTLEDLTVWSGNNAYATTVEVWDLRKYVAGTDRLLTEALARSHRVKYQLKRREVGWQVLYREAVPIE